MGDSLVTAHTILIGFIISVGTIYCFIHYYSLDPSPFSNKKNNSKYSDGDGNKSSTRSDSGGGSRTNNALISHQSIHPNDGSAVHRTNKGHRRHVVEVCLSDIQSLVEACQGNCNSIELCVNRLEGGVTPSYALIEQCVQQVIAITTNSHNHRHIDLHVLIRPRPGGFHYTDAEFDIIKRDVLIAKQLGVDGMKAIPYT